MRKEKTNWGGHIICLLQHDHLKLQEVKTPRICALTWSLMDLYFLLLYKIFIVELESRKSFKNILIYQEYRGGLWYCILFDWDNRNRTLLHDRTGHRNSSVASARMAKIKQQQMPSVCSLAGTIYCVDRFMSKQVIFHTLMYTRALRSLKCIRGKIVRL